MPQRDRSLNLTLVGDVFLEHLEKRRQDFVKPQARRKKMNVAPGKSVSASDLEPPTSTDVEEASTAGKHKKSLTKGKKPPTNKRKKPDPSDSTSENEDDFSTQDSGESDLVISENSEDEMFEPLPDPQPQPSSSGSGSSSLDPGKIIEADKIIQNSLKPGNFVLVSWNDAVYPGIVSTIDQTGAFVDCMAPTKKAWKWPAVKGILHYKWCDINKIITPPRPFKRGLFTVAESIDK